MIIKSQAAPPAWRAWNDVDDNVDIDNTAFRYEIVHPRFENADLDEVKEDLDELETRVETIENSDHEQRIGDLEEAVGVFSDFVLELDSKVEEIKGTLDEEEAEKNVDEEKGGWEEEGKTWETQPPNETTEDNDDDDDDDDEDEEEFGSGNVCERFDKVGDYYILVVDDEDDIWSDAYFACKDLGGKLLTLETDEKQLTMISHLYHNYPAWLRFWVGGYTDGNNGTWFWRQGDFSAVEIETSWWQVGEPSDHGENCMEIAQEKRYQWNDLACDSMLNFVCECTPPPEFTDYNY